MAQHDCDQQKRCFLEQIQAKEKPEEAKKTTKENKRTPLQKTFAFAV